MEAKDGETVLRLLVDEYNRGEKEFPVDIRNAYTIDNILSYPNAKKDLRLAEIAFSAGQEQSRRETMEYEKKSIPAIREQARKVGIIETRCNHYEAMKETLQAIKNLCDGYTELDKETCSLYIGKVLSQLKDGE